MLSHFSITFIIIMNLSVISKYLEFQENSNFHLLILPMNFTLLVVCDWVINDSSLSIITISKHVQAKTKGEKEISFS